MPKRNLPTKATIVETLVYFDEPQLLLLESDRKNKMLAVAVNALDSQLAFFGCEVRDKPFAKYMQGKADLHYVFSKCMRDSYYFFDLSAIEGKEVRLSYVDEIVQVMYEKYDELDFSYDTIYGILKNEKLLKKGPRAKFSKVDIRKLVKKRTDEFAKAMGIECGDILYEASGRNTLVYSKMILSIYRRANEVYAFHAEGRVQSE